MNPYYQQDGITIYNADCRDVLVPGWLVADMVFTDPPYGVQYDGGHCLSGRAREMLYDDDTNVYAWLMPLLRNHCNGPAYIWFAGIRCKEFFNALDGWDIHSLLIWNKTNGTNTAMFAHYKERKEHMLYCKPTGTTLRWCGPTNECTVWDMPRDASNEWHPTQKPVHLAARAIRNHTSRTVLDPFCGAGSTLVAARMLGRAAIGIEIDEGYCEKAAQRLQQTVLDIAPAARLMEQSELWKAAP